MLFQLLLCMVIELINVVKNEFGEFEDYDYSHLTNKLLNQEYSDDNHTTKVNKQTTEPTIRNSIV